MEIERPKKVTTLLNVVIPTYNQYTLFINALKSVIKLKQDYPELVRIIVVDDSSDQAISQRIKQFCYSLDIQYVRSFSRDGPTSWNKYRLFQGLYTWILHHDEMFIGDHHKLVQTINSSIGKYAFILQSLSNKHRYNPFIATYLLNKFPRLILYSNFIGSPSNVIFPTSFSLCFKKEFPLTTDIIFYYELARQPTLSFVPLKSCSTFTIDNDKSIKQSLSSLNSRKKHVQELILYCSLHHLKLSSFDLIASYLFYILMKILLKLGYIFSLAHS